MEPLSEQTNNFKVKQPQSCSRQSPDSPSRTFKGESIRSLRGLLHLSLTASFRSEEEEKKEEGKLEKIGNQQPVKQVDSKEKVSTDGTGGDDEAEKQRQRGLEARDEASARRRATVHANEVRSRLLQNLGIPPKEPPRVDTRRPQLAVTSNSTSVVVSSAKQPSPANSTPKSVNNEWGPSYTAKLNDDEDGSADEESEMTVDGTNDSKTLTIKNITESTDCEEENDSKNTSTTSDTDENIIDGDTTDKKKSVRFQPSVIIHPIPSHKVYSDRIKHTVWTGAWELEENVARNSLEFAYEGWDASKVLDEDTGLLYYLQPSHGGVGSAGKPSGEWIHPVHFGLQPPAPDEGEKEDDDDEVEKTVSEEEMWKQTCERLGIQPAEFYHNHSQPPAPQKPQTAQ